jgi:hypothetical protein
MAMPMSISTQSIIHAVSTLDSDIINDATINRPKWEEKEGFVSDIWLNGFVYEYNLTFNRPFRRVQIAFFSFVFGGAFIWFMSFLTEIIYPGKYLTEPQFFVLLIVGMFIGLYLFKQMEGTFFIQRLARHKGIGADTVEEQPSAPSRPSPSNIFDVPPQDDQ